MSFPSIQAPSYPLEESVYKPQIKSEFESGYVQSRAKGTIAKRTWSLMWTAMPEADWVSLYSSFTSDIGSTFTWTHPVSGEYTVRYSEDSLISTVQAPGLRNVQLKLEEAP